MLTETKPQVMAALDMMKRLVIDPRGYTEFVEAMREDTRLIDQFEGIEEGIRMAREEVLRGRIYLPGLERGESRRIAG